MYVQKEIASQFYEYWKLIHKTSFSFYDTRRYFFLENDFIILKK